MGRDKASLRLDGGPDVAPAGAGGITLAERTASTLLAVCSPAVEVGPGHTRLRAVQEDPPGAGPLAAVVAGSSALCADGWTGPVVVVATDLPALSVAMIAWLADRDGTRSVVPVAAGRVQPLCARYSPADLAVAAGLVSAGRRAMTALLEATDPDLVAEEIWAAAVGGADVLADADTPDELHRITGP